MGLFASGFFKMFVFVSVVCINKDSLYIILSKSVTNLISLIVGFGCLIVTPWRNRESDDVLYLLANQSRMSFMLCSRCLCIFFQTISLYKLETHFLTLQNKPVFLTKWNVLCKRCGLKHTNFRDYSLALNNNVWNSFIILSITRTKNYNIYYTKTA